MAQTPQRSAAQEPASPELPAAARAWVPAVQPAGRGRLTFWGLAVYDASLWVAPGFRHGDFAAHAFALDITYLRSFSAADVARRSVDEMRRAGSFDAAQAGRWQDALQALLPDVASGDRLTGVHRPGRGAAFLFNGKPIGEIDDPRFARLFFAIWLGQSSSEPQLRQALLEGTAP